MEDTLEKIPYAIFSTAIVAWCLISYKMVDTIPMIKFSLYLLTPIMIVVELLEAWRYYKINYLLIAPKLVAPPSTWLERSATPLLLSFSLIYFISSVAESKKIEVRNSLLLKLNQYKKRISVGISIRNPFTTLQLFIYLSFFNYFDYIMLLMTLLASMVDINLMNFGMFAFSVSIMAMQKLKASNAWIYYVFFIDLCTLVK